MCCGDPLEFFDLEADALVRILATIHEVPLGPSLNALTSHMLNYVTVYKVCFV